MRYTLGHPLVDAVLDDLRVSSTALKAFRILWAQLDFAEHREKKSEVLAAEIGVDRTGASRALQELVLLGYVESGERNAKGVGTYRLPRQVPTGVHQTHTSAIPRKVRRQIRSSL